MKKVISNKLQFQFTKNYLSITNRTHNLNFGLTINLNQKFYHSTGYVFGNPVITIVYDNVNNYKFGVKDDTEMEELYEFIMTGLLKYSDKISQHYYDWET